MVQLISHGLPGPVRIARWGEMGHQSVGVVRQGESYVGESMVRGYHAYKIGGMLLMGNHLASKATPMMKGV